MSPPNGVPPGNDGGYAALPVVPTTVTDAAKDCKCDETNPTLTKDNNKQSTEAVSSATDDDSEGELMVPPDGGWGWVVVGGSFACNMVVDGIIFCFGLFLNDIQISLNCTMAEVSLVGSLLSGFYLMCGPFASALANRYGFRLVAILGSILAASAFAVSYYATSVQFLFISYGIIGGIGFGFVYVPAVVIVGFYFERWRALATGIAVCGSGIGTFVFAPLIQYLQSEIGWRNTFLAQGAVVLSCVIFAATFRPLKPTKIKELKAKESSEKPELVMDSNKLPTKTRQNMEAVLGVLRANSTPSLHGSQSTIPRLFGVNNNAQYPTVADVWYQGENKVYNTINESNQRRKTLESHGKRLSAPLMSTDYVLRNEDNPKGETPLLNVDHKNPVINKRLQLNETSRPRTYSEGGARKRAGTLTATDVNRPFYRDDIFFGASLSKLPQYTSQTSVGYNLSVVRLPTQTDVEEEENKTCKICPEAVRRTLATMLDISLFKSPSFLVLAVSGACTMMGFYTPYVFLVKRGEEFGMTAQQATFLVSVIGIANTVGRVLSGIFSSLPNVNVLLVSNATMTIAGISTALSGLWLTEEYQFFYSVVFGLSISCFSSLRSVLVVELLGLEKLTNAFGLLLMFQGFAACIGPPMAAEFMRVTDSFDACFYLSGSFLFVSAVMCYPLNAINRWEKRRNGDCATKAVAV